MKPFCGYNFADYWGHWLSFENRSDALPRDLPCELVPPGSRRPLPVAGIRRNLRVLRWIIDRCRDRAGAVESPIGYLPEPGAIDTSGLSIKPETMRELLSVDPEAWKEEMRSIGEYFQTYGDRVPQRLRAEHGKVLSALS